MQPGMAEEAAMAPRRLRFLVVEDDADMRSFIVDALHEFGDGMETTDYDAAMAVLLAPSRPRLDLVVVDCVLPNRRRRLLAGIALLRFIAERWPSLPVLVITGAELGEELVIDSFRSGARDFLRKPFDLDELLSAVERVTRRRRAEPVEHGAASRAVREVVKFVAEHYTEPLSLDDLAAMAGLGRDAFARVFREIVGLSLRDYLLDLRVERARQLLLESNRSLTEIAQESGFYDLPHLDKAFRRRFLLSPSDYRRQSAPPGADCNVDPAATALPPQD